MNYDREERIAIRIDSGMSEREAILLTDSENKLPECIERLQKFKERKTLDDAAKHVKKSRFIYE